MSKKKRIKPVESRQKQTNRLPSENVPSEKARLAQKREQILQGALRVFLAQGYSASMDSIAAEAGVVKQTVYSYFEDKKALFAALMDRLLDKFLTTGMTPDILSLEPAPFLRKIVQIALAKMDDWEYVSLLRLLIGESERFPEFAELYVSRLVQPGIENLANYIRRNETLRFADPEATARVIHGSVIYYIILQELLNGKHTMPMSRERMTTAIVDMVLFAAEAGRQSR